MGILKNKKSLRFSAMFLAENLNIPCSASIAFDESNTLWAKSKPLYNKKRARVQGENPYILALAFSSVDMSTSLTRYAFATLRTPKAHSSLRGTPAAQARYIVAPRQFDMR